MNFITKILVIFGLFLIPSAKCQSEERTVVNRILADYDKLDRPSSIAKEPTNVTVNMYIRSIDNLDDVNMNFDTQITFRMQWTDPRLAYTQIKNRTYINLLEFDKIWIPDLFFSNAREEHRFNLVTPNAYLRIFPEGYVLYSTRLSLKLSCPMILKLFPFDKQTCNIRMASYGYTKDDIELKWKVADPVQVTSDLHLPTFSLEAFNTDYCDSQTNTGVYSCLRVDFLFARDSSYYIQEIFIPCIMMVIISYLSFWIHPLKHSTTRLLISLVTLLVMATQISRFNENLPRVSYKKAIDFWTGISLTFVFATLVEFIIVHKMHENCKNQNQPAESHDETEDNLIQTIGSRQGQQDNKGQGQNHCQLGKRQCNWREKFSNFRKPETIDFYAKMIYPGAFLVFNLWFWVGYLLHK